MKKTNIAFCGLDCERCDARFATKNDDYVLREKTARLWSELNNAPILPEHIRCDGCRADGCKTFFCSNLCEIRKCAVERGVETCGGCAEIEICEKAAKIFDNNPEAKNNLI